MRSLCPLLCFVAACAGEPNAVLVDLSPTVISSLDGTTTVTALVASDSTPLADEAATATITYTDRNGTPHAIADVKGSTDERGVFTTTVTGLTWDGTGTVTVTTANGVTGAATFTVLDRTAPTVEILPPTSDLRVGPGLPIEVRVRVQDEIGVSEVTVDDNGIVNNATRSTVVASGSQDTTLAFQMGIPLGAQAGPTIKLYAIASDLSGNIGVAPPVTLTVDPSITIATPPGLTGALLADGTQNQLNDPRAIVFSSKDNHLYIADITGNGACAPTCVWRVDPGTGTIDSTPVFVGSQTIEGLALDATGTNLYLADNGNRIRMLTWNGTAYATPVDCAASQDPQDPFHIVFDGTNILAVDGQDKNVQSIAAATCSGTTTPTAVTPQDSFDAPRGIALGPAANELYVADNGDDRVSKVDATTGNRTTFANVDSPYGLEWLGTSAATDFANSLFIASMGQREIVSVRSTGSRAASYLRNTPIDVTIAGGTLYILTTPSANNRGRVYKVSGL